ncbi:MAG: hypothetical protein J6V62_01265 [Paludibacteraceae bacterium]|nr:hypothetical protein [Paludibacteraceae bacterium]
MFGLSEISWGNFLLATALLCLLFNVGVWAYFWWDAKRSSHPSARRKQQKFHQSLPF